MAKFGPNKNVFQSKYTIRKYVQCIDLDLKMTLT